MIMIIIYFFLWITIDVMVTGTLIIWLQLFRKQILCNLQYMYPPIYFCQYGNEFPNVCENFSGVIQKILPMLPSIAHIPFSPHALMTALHMFFMAWFIQISTRILLLSHSKFLEAIQAQMGEVRIFRICYLFCLVVWVWKWRFKKEQQQLLKKKQQQFDWFYYFLFTGKSRRHLIKCSHYITHTHQQVCVFLY